MVKKVKELIFCFENLEQMSVPAKDVEMYCFKNVHTNIFSYSEKDYLETTCAEEAIVLLKKEADRSAVSSFDMEADTNITRYGLFRRLELFQDCVGIDILFEDGERKEIYIPWEDAENEQTNKCQHMFIQKNEYLRGHGCFCVHFGRTTELMDNFRRE